MITIPNFRKGDSVNWETELPSKYQEGWTLKWAIRGQNHLQITATQTVPNTTFYSSINTVQSSGLIKGVYSWAAAVTKDDQRITLANGELTVEADLFSVSEVFDVRTTAKKMLDTVNEAIFLVSSGAKASYKINDREFTFQTLPDLTRWRDKLKIEVDRERALEKMRQGLADQRIIHSRFSNYYGQKTL